MYMEEGCNTAEHGWLSHPIHLFLVIFILTDVSLVNIVLIKVQYNCLIQYDAIHCQRNNGPWPLSLKLCTAKMNAHPIKS